MVCYIMIEVNSMTVGSRIKEARKKAGLTQAQLGKKLKVSQQMIGQFENNKNSPTIPTLNKIADALNIPVLELLMGFGTTQKLEKSVKKYTIFDQLVESMGYTVEFQENEDFYTISKDGNMICTFETDDFAQIRTFVISHIEFCIKLKSLSSFDCMPYTEE